MIFMLCGTSDARELALQLQQQGWALETSVVTESAEASLREVGLPVRTGRMTSELMADYIHSHNIRVLVDASHPFAEEAHRNAMAAAQQTDIPYIRYERPGLAYGDHPGLTIAADYEEAALAAKAKKGSVMLTTGSKTLPIFAKHLLGDPEIRLVARMLPRTDNMELCAKLGVEQKNIIAMQGPFSKEMNEALFRMYKTTVMVTKESGATGAVDEKVEAALQLGIDVILISRPELEFGQVFHDYNGVIQAIQTFMKEEQADGL